MGASVLDLCRKLARKKGDRDKRRLLLVDNGSVLSIVVGSDVKCPKAGTFDATHG